MDVIAKSVLLGSIYIYIYVNILLLLWKVPQEGLKKILLDVKSPSVGFRVVKAWG